MRTTRRDLLEPLGIASVPSADLRTWLPLLWQWMNENRAMNFDDSGPRTYDAFARLMQARLLSRELLWGVRLEGIPVGVIGYDPVHPQCGMFHGICFTQHAHGTGVAFEAVRAVLADRFADGVETIRATFFADNRRVTRFFEKLGAVHEGLLDATTRRDGVPVAVRVMAWYPRQKGD